MKVEILLLILTYTYVVKRAKAELTGFIVGGEKSKIKYFPHSVFLHIRPEDSICGASILNQAILLTAAHCVNFCEGQRCIITAYTGSERKFKGAARKVFSFKVHEKYNDRTKANDIALLRLANNLKLGKMVKRIIVMKNPPKHETAKVAGWGRVSRAEGSSSFVLKHTKQRILDRNTCQTIVPNIPKGTFCGQDRGYPHRGDSGGALVIEKEMIQIGIVSFKKPFHSKNTEVYTDVSYFYDWIAANARTLYCAGSK